MGNLLRAIRWLSVAVDKLYTYNDQVDASQFAQLQAQPTDK